MNTCTCCYNDYIVKCTDVINVFAKLAPTTDYKWVITDKFNRQYEGTFSTDDDGFWQIPIADLPAGLLTEYSGDFKLQVYIQGALCTPSNFTIAQVTDCIVFNVHAGTREKNNIGCAF